MKIVTASIAIFLIPLTLSAVAEDSATGDGKDLLSLENGTSRVGINRSRGAAITWLSSSARPANMVNSADPGRLIQQSYYAGNSLDRTAEGQSKSWSPWTWNPIQGGGVGSWARVTEFKKLDDLTLFGETIPKLWDMPNEEASAIMGQWTGFEPGMPDVIVVRNEFVAKRSADDRWGAARPSSQEVPACYFTRDLNHFKSYLGGGNWREETQPPGPPWGQAKPPLKAMACFDDNGLGIAIFSPTSGDSWNFGPHGSEVTGDPSAGPCVHIAPIASVNLGPQSSYSYRYWLILGDAGHIAARIDALLTKYPAEKAVLENR